MKKYIKIFTILLFVSVIFVQPSYSQTCNDRAYYILKESTVKLFIETTDGYYAGCTGIIVHKDNKSTGILTAGHCVEDANKIVIDYIYTVSKFIKAKKSDIAYLIIDDVIIHKNRVKISRYNASAGSSIFTLGYPGLNEVYNCAKILSNGLRNVYSNAKVIPGCSGSGVINIRGELIGIIWGGYFDKETKICSMSIFTNIESIRQFLKSINVLKEDLIYIK